MRLIANGGLCPLNPLFPPSEGRQTAVDRLLLIGCTELQRGKLMPKTRKEKETLTD